MDNATASSASPLSRWDLLPLAGALALGLIALKLWPQLPDLIPTHFGPGGLPDSWTAKAAAPWLMFGFPLGTWILLALVGVVPSPRGPMHKAAMAQAMAPLRGLLVLGCFLITSLTVLIPAYGLWVFGPVLGGFFALLLAGIVLMSRQVKDLIPPDLRQAYRWGLFYYNPADPKVWVEKLIGIGWTLNFARPVAWLWLVMMLVPVFIILAVAAWR